MAQLQRRCAASECCRLKIGNTLKELRFSGSLMVDEKARPMAKASVQVENERVVVTEWRFTPGAHTGWHRHERDYVVVPMTTGPLEIFDGKQNLQAPLRQGVSYARAAGVEHDVINPNDFEFVFVEIELKS